MRGIKKRRTTQTARWKHSQTNSGILFHTEATQLLLSSENRKMVCIMHKKKKRIREITVMGKSLEIQREKLRRMQA